MLATRELLRREHLGKIAGKTFVIQASAEAAAPHDSVSCMHAAAVRLVKLFQTEHAQFDACGLLQSRSLRLA